MATIFNAPPSDEAANMAALVVTNAMVFQERLASADPAIQPTSASRRNGVFSRLRLLTMWDAILDIDYYPIFSMARDVVSELSDVEAAAVLEECAQTAAQLLGMGAVGRHDLAGRIFNRLIADRKLLAAFYTSIPAATLLAGLALSPARWPRVDWSDAASLRQLRVVDPACGTGTLLMAAYQQIVQNHATAFTPSPSTMCPDRGDGLQVFGDMVYTFRPDPAGPACPDRPSGSGWPSSHRWRWVATPQAGRAAPWAAGTRGPETTPSRPPGRDGRGRRDRRAGAAAGRDRAGG